MRNIFNQPTISPMPQEIDDEFKITPDEVEKLIKGAKYLTPMTIKSCSYLLPCGICDKTDQVLKMRMFVDFKMIKLCI